MEQPCYDYLELRNNQDTWLKVVFKNYPFYL